MDIIGIKELQTNPGKLSKSFDNNEYLLITRRGKPFGIAMPFSNDLMEQGLQPWMALRAFQSGDLSLGQLAISLDKNKVETLEMLGQLNIPVADYDLQEDLAAVEKLLAS
ncbi:MAG: UPF0175 family protein [Thiotrichaceae bacterium]